MRSTLTAGGCKAANSRRIAADSGSVCPLPLFGEKHHVVIEYFKALAEETGIPYQNLINLYLRECARTGKKPALSWAS